MTAGEENKSGQGATAQSENTSPLSYSPRRQGSLRRTLLRRVVPAILALLVAWVAFAQRKELALRAGRIYWGHQCATHVIPPGTVLVESGPQKAKDLLAQNPDYVQDRTQWNGLTRGKMLSDSSPTPFRAAYWPRDFRAYYPFVPAGQQMLGGTFAIAFMGERRSPGGHRRLIVIPYGVLSAFWAEAFLRHSYVLPLPDWLGRLESLRRAPLALNFSGPYVPMRLLPGVADPNDASHITLPFEAGENAQKRQGIIDIYLLSDDSLSVKLRNPSDIQGL